MVVKNQIKFIKNLYQKKYRIQHGMFVAEGMKAVSELLNSHFRAHKIYCTDTESFKKFDVEVQQITENDLKKISGLQSPNKVLAIFKIPTPKIVDHNDWILALDDVRDPGNLGTIIRLCDWFGVHNLVCSLNTVDCYNPKVLQATMGSIARVNIVYNDLTVFLNSAQCLVYGAFMGGANVYDEELPERGILVMGNEANGISEKVTQLITKQIAIPQFGEPTTESLNVATATSILLNEIRRK
ncbi:TrmH family RNA methyltransferase [Spongiimicrobium sp. 3-5]|uniref:TrmH family RNA methyltransferase n=1 Tax=Spongiimicrobium sp. 3-5 TaxID=3332596 RepID=UPI0039812E98